MLHASQSRVPARLPTVLLGAVTGLTSALILELTGHSAIAILSLLAASIVLSYLATINPPPALSSDCIDSVTPEQHGVAAALSSCW